MKYDPIDSQLFEANRKRFYEEIEPGSIAIFNANDEMPKSADQAFDFKQNADLFWLSGIDQEQTILVLFPDNPNPKQREVLFLRKTSDLIAIWEGHKYTKEEAREASGIQTVMWLEDFDTVFPPMMHASKDAYVNINEHDRYVHTVPYRDLRFANDLKERYPAHRIHRAAPIMHKLRSVKHALEIEAMQKACDITDLAFRRVLGFVKPGVWEHEIEAEVIHEFLRNRATGHAYSPIIASGGNACVLHYVDNNMECKDGDLILMDFGAEYGNYCADLTRTIPVNGKFTDRQKDVYNAVLRVMRGAMQMLVPGTILEEYHVEVGKLMQEELVGLGLITTEDIKNEDPNWPAYKKYFMHGTSHYIGLDVHDVGSKWVPFEEGMVFTCEPGIYIPEENIGIRIENDLMVKSGGPADLMGNIPIEVEEIEEMMNQSVTA
jgi:Xaa-Pro aminopeptidase